MRWGRNDTAGAAIAISHRPSTTHGRRHMNIHEYQAKGLLKRYGVGVARGGVAYTPEEAENVARELGGPVWVVKSQVHAGGRGAGHFV